MNVLAERLRSLDKSLSRLTAERLKVLAEIAKLDAEDGASERQTASRVARLISGTPKQAASELAMAKQVSTLPTVADAHARGELSNGQLGAVAEIAAASSEGEALELAKTGTSSQLHQRAAVCRGKLFEERRNAHKARYLAFKPEGDGQSTRIHGRLPFAECKQLEMQLRKIADRLNLGDKERPSPSARMADALLILTKHNSSQALHDHEEQASRNGQPTSTQTEATKSSPTQTTNGSSGDTSAGEPTAATNRTGTSSQSQTRPKLYALRSNAAGAAQSSKPATTTTNRQAETPSSNTVEPVTAPEPPGLLTDQQAGSGTPAPWPTGISKPVIDYDEEPFPEIDSDTDAYFQGDSETNDETNDETSDEADDEVSDSALATINHVVVQRADTRLIIHWNAQTGSINFENGPAIDHPRLQALLCDARIDIQHCDANGLPTGLITTAHHSNWRQDRYLAFRDGPCRIPECEGIGKTQAHHIFEDRIDRVTSVEYMINVCARCHQEHHDGTFSISGKPEQTTTFTYQDGTILYSPARPLPGNLKNPKPIPLTKHAPQNDETVLFSMSA